jgi:hypothetical protein
MLYYHNNKKTYKSIKSILKCKENENERLHKRAGKPLLLGCCSEKNQANACEVTVEVNWGKADR